MSEEREKQQQEFNGGLGNVTQGVIESLAEVGIVVRTDEIMYEPAWRPGRPIPEAIEIRVAPEGAPTVRTHFSREQIDDSWDRLDRADVRQRIRAITAEFIRLRGGSAR